MTRPLHCGGASVVLHGSGARSALLACSSMPASRMVLWCMEENQYGSHWPSRLKPSIFSACSLDRASAGPAFSISSADNTWRGYSFLTPIIKIFGPLKTPQHNFIQPFCEKYGTQLHPVSCCISYGSLDSPRSVIIYPQGHYAGREIIRCQVGFSLRQWTDCQANSQSQRERPR
jgi:hypothetical protein